jgi:hypothetical protein
MTRLFCPSLAVSMSRKNGRLFEPISFLFLGFFWAAAIHTDATFAFGQVVMYSSCIWTACQLYVVVAFGQLVKCDDVQMVIVFGQRLHVCGSCITAC